MNLGIKRLGLTLVLLLGVVMLAVPFFALTFQDKAETDFTPGIFNNTSYNTTGNFVSLNSTLTAGNFTSRVFDAKTSATWDNMSWIEGAPYGEELPDNRRDETGDVLSPANMSRALVLFHFNNDSSAGESDTRMYDFTHSGRNGSCTGAGCPSFNHTGKIKGGFTFYGVENDGINISAFNFTGEVLSFAFWFRTNSTESANQLILTDGNRQGFSGFIFFFRGGNSLWYDSTNGDNAIQELQFTNAFTGFTNDRWVHFVITANYSARNVLVYRNGILADNKTQTVTMLFPTSNRTKVLGNSYQTGYTNLQLNHTTLDEFAIFDAQLSAHEVLNLYKRGSQRLNLTVRTSNDNVTFTDWVGAGNSTSTQFNNSSFADLSNLNTFRFFQYQFVFDSNTTAYSVELYNATIEYTSFDPPANPTITAPANNSTITSAFPNTTVLVIDNGNASSYTEIIANGSNKSYGLVQNNTETNLSWSSTSDGIYTYYARSYDNFSNNVSEGNMTLIVDTTKPTISVNANSVSNTTVNNNTGVLLNFTITDNTYRENQSLELANSQNGTTANYSFTKQGSAFVYSINLSSLSWGNYTYVVYANDSGNNEQRLETNWVFVNTLPKVNVSSPSNNSTTTSAFPNVTVNIVDNEQAATRVEIFANGTNTSYNGNLGNNTLTNLTWSSTSDGIYDYFVRAYDNTSNNVSVANQSIIVDTTSPAISNNTASMINITTNNSTGMWFNFSITDNIYLENTSLELRNQQNDTTTNYSLSKEGVTFNYTINLSNLTSGNYSFVVFANDSGGNQQRFPSNWFYIDTAPPIIENITNSPNDTNDLDPNNTVVNISVDADDDSSSDATGIGITAVVLEFSTNGTTIHNRTMLNESGNRRWGNFTLNATGNWTYRIYANDTSGKVNRSANTTIEVAYDYTWTINPENLSTTSAAIGNNITIANITLNNTGDYAQTFVIAKDIAVVPTVVLNQSSATLEQGRQTSIQVNVTPPTTAGTYVMSIKFTANNTTQSAPLNNYSNGTFISRGDGPFLFLEVDYINVTAAQGETVAVNIKVTNYGNQSAANTWIAYSVPSDWSGTTNNSLGTVGPNETVSWSNVTFDVASGAKTGPQPVLVYPGFASYKHNQTSNVSSSVVITATSTTTTTKTTTVTTGGGGVGGGGGGVSGLSEAQKETLFGTAKTYDLVVGKDKAFPFVVGNPYVNGEMHNTTIQVEGLLSQYLRVQPNFVSKIPREGNFPVNVLITAPAYFTEGKHELTFTISTTVAKGVVRTKAVETTKVVLRVHEISTEEANKLISKSKELLQRLKDAGFYYLGAQALLEQGLKGLEDGDYKKVSEVSKEMEDTVRYAFDSDRKIKELDEKINIAGSYGARVVESLRLLDNAKFAFARGDFKTAFERTKESDLAYLVETNYFNLAYAIRSNLRAVFFGSLSAIITGVIFFFYGKYSLLTLELRKYSEEEDIILGLMKTIQKECFEDGKMSISDYSNAMLQYENKLNTVVQRIIELDSKIRHLVKFVGEEQQLKDEKEKIRAMIKGTQARFIEKGDLETRVYEDRIRSFTSRLSEIEEKQATLAAEKEIKKKVGVKWWFGA